jgi:DNA-binding transcriptional MerR regulator
MTISLSPASPHIGEPERASSSHSEPASTNVIPASGDLANANITGYRGPQVCKIVGITYRQLDYWARTDLVRPSITDAAGSGTQRLYSYRDLVALKVIKSLLDAGVSLQMARRAIEYLQTHLGEDLASASLILNGANSVIASTGDELVDLIRTGQGVLNIVPLGAVQHELDARIVELDPAVSLLRAASGT